MTTSDPQILTVGHSNHPADTLTSMLRGQDVTAVADVRSVPYSRYTPQFNSDLLRDCLWTHRIRYVFLGRELGARSNDPTCYVNGRVQYERLARTDLFRSGIRRVLKGAKTERIALLCAEKEPLECHRAVLIAQVLAEHGHEVGHILDGGLLESHSEAMLRLLDKFKLPRADLLRSTDEIIRVAVARQGERIAYVDPTLATAAGG